MKTTKLLVSLGILIFLAGCSDQNKNTEPKDLLTDGEVDALIEDPEFMGDYIKEMKEAIEEEKINEDMKLVDELIDLEEDKKAGNKSMGSCDAIEASSTCIEYYGSFWTDQIIEAGCDGIFSKDPCPTGMSGGCNTGVGSAADMVAWMYLTGGGEMTPESMKHAGMACDATMASRWITTK